MNNFKIINDTNDIKLSKKWVDSTKFNRKNKLVDKNGKPITSSYNGRQYRLIAKKEKTFSILERIKRVFLGSLAVLFSLGIALTSKSIRNLFLKEKTKIRYGILVPPSSSNSSDTSSHSSSTNNYTPILPNDVHLHIFSYLDMENLKRTAQVNKNFMELSNQKKIDWINSNGKSIFKLNSNVDYIISLLKDHGHKLKYLKINRKLKLQEILKLINFCPNLVNLVIKHSRISDTDLIEILKLEHLNNLKLLDLSNNWIGDKGAIALARSEIYQNLEHLILNNNYIKNEGAQELANPENTNNLQVLSLKCFTFNAIKKTMMRKTFFIEKYDEMLSAEINKFQAPIKLDEIFNELCIRSLYEKLYKKATNIANTNPFLWMQFDFY